MTQANPADHELIEPTKIVSITMRDGETLYAALFLPKEPGRYPTLFAASPYRFDNDYAPAYPMYLWRETGPVAWYVDHGYAFLHMDVRGTGRSGGEYRFLDEVEQHDLYDAIEWIATQPWSDGNVGGIGQSYYAVMQWFMAIQSPPHLKCIAPRRLSGFGVFGRHPRRVLQPLVQSAIATDQSVSGAWSVTRIALGHALCGAASHDLRRVLERARGR